MRWSTKCLGSSSPRSSHIRGNQLHLCVHTYTEHTIMRHNSGGCYPTICIFSHILLYIFCTFSVCIMLHALSYVCVCTYWGDFDCQNNLCVIFADRRQIHTSTTCLSLFVNTCALTVVVIAPVLNGNRMEIVVEMGFLCVSTQLHSKSAIVLVISSEDENRTTKLPVKGLVWEY